MTIKLHLGCGQIYFDGYLNIDYPLSEHTVQVSSVADLYSDITKLKYRKDEISEIRLHHVFEHFRRQQAAALIAIWAFWIHPGGRLYIEVPDLRKMAKILSSSFTGMKARAVAERHLYGSHEAHWAAHYEAYDSKIMKVLLQTFGFNVTKIKDSYWKGIWNLHVFAVRNEEDFTKEKILKSAREYFKLFLVDNSEGELKMLDVWMTDFELQLNIGI